MRSKSNLSKWLRLTVLVVLVTSVQAQAGLRADGGHLDQIEQELRHLADNVINQDRTLTFKRVGGGTTATNWMVKNAQGEAIANLKCTSGNTNHYAAPATYQLGRLLDFNIFPVAVPIRLQSNTVSGVAEQNCALKEWATNYTQYFWTRDTFAAAGNATKTTLVNALNCKNNVNFTAAYNFDQTSSFGSPQLGSKTRYLGKSTLLQVAKDFSNMMIMDTVIGNDDRFPGGNTFFRSEADQIQREGNALRFVEARLFSLDNEAAFKRDASNGENDMKKYLSRFDYDFLAKLGNLQEELKANPNKYPALNFKTQSSKKTAAQHIVDNISDIIKHVNAMAERCGSENLYFPR